MADSVDETPLPVSPAPDATPTASAPVPPDWKAWPGRIAAAKTHRDDDHLEDWQTNVAYRMMEVFPETDGDDVAGSGTDRVAVPEDWARTKQKQAQLAFQLPKIVAKGLTPESTPFAAHVTAAVNKVLRGQCKAHYMIDECLADAINAAGLLVSKIRVDVVTEQVAVPQPAVPPTVLPDASTIPSAPEVATMTRVVSRRHAWDRVSPANFLWPREFRSSHWDQAPWLGHEAYLPVTVCKRHPVWGPKIAAALAAGQTIQTYDKQADHLASDLSGQDGSTSGTVPCYCVQEVWYKAAQFDEDANHPDHLRTLVFIEGIDEPVQTGDADEQQYVPPMPETPAVPAHVDPATGQQVPEVPAKPGYPGFYKGLSAYPLRVETLTYVSDLAVPPSDSRAGRAQVNELMRSRAQMLRQRDTSIPIRWYDVNRVDEPIAEAIRKGIWQDLIPMNGPGDRAIGEVARANYPRENFQFQSILGTDLDGAWSLSNNQLATPNGGERSATEVTVVQGASQIRSDYEKTRVNRYLADGAAVLWSLMARYNTAPDWVEILGADGAAQLVQMPAAAYDGTYAFEFIPDSSDRIDLPTRQNNALKLYNLAANDPNMNRLELLKEVVALHGGDPERFIKPAPPAEPEAPAVSLRLDNESLLNPMAVAIVTKQYKITPQDIAAAAAMIQDAIAHTVKLPPPGIADGTPTLPTGAPPPAGPPEKVEPPEVQEAILKRSVSGEHLT